MTAVLAMAVATIVANPVPETWVDAVEHVESGGRNIYGDAGKAAGVFQFWSVSWADCSKVRAKAGLPIHPYSKAKDRVVARDYARTWLTYLRNRLTIEIGRPASAAETWLAYNLGMTGFKAYGYQWAFVPHDKFSKALVIQQLANKKK
jgi:hypothetical protein